MNRRHALATVAVATTGLAVLSTPVPFTVAALNDVVTLEIGASAWRPVPVDPPSAEPPAPLAAPAEPAPPAWPEGGPAAEAPAPEPVAPAGPEDGPATEAPAPEPTPDAAPEGSEPGAPPASEPTAVPVTDTTASPVEEAPSTTGPEDVDVSEDVASTDPAPTSDG